MRAPERFPRSAPKGCRSNDQGVVEERSLTTFSVLPDHAAPGQRFDDGSDQLRPLRGRVLAAFVLDENVPETSAGDRSRPREPLPRELRPRLEPAFEKSYDVKRQISGWSLQVSRRKSPRRGRDRLPAAQEVPG